MKVLRIVASLVMLATVLVNVSYSGSVAAGPGDNFSLVKAGPSEALIGEEITYTLNATGDHSSGAALFNLSFRDVLQVGVSFVSATPAPTVVLDDVPASGQTTVIWENVSDLPANSQSSVSITVDTNPDFAGGSTGSGTVPVGSTINNSGEAVASLNPFTIPDYDLASGLFAGDFDGSATDTATTSVVPCRVTKIAPAELLRGVHANGLSGASGSTGALYTIGIENNPDYPVTAVTLEDVLHPGLEFMGCDNYIPPGGPWADNTSIGEEWPGAGAVATGIGCSANPENQPTTIDTNAAGETVVNWTLPDLAPGQTISVQYQAGIPLFANVAFGSGAPAATSLTQARTQPGQQHRRPNW